MKKWLIIIFWFIAVIALLGLDIYMFAHPQEFETDGVILWTLGTSGILALFGIPVGWLLKERRYVE